MKSDNYLSKLVLITSVLISLVAFIFLPVLLKDNSDEEFKICTLRNSWGENTSALPTPTKYAILYSDHKIIRFTIFALFAAAGVILETRCKNKIITGTYHLVILLLGVIISGLFLLACILPSVPI